MNAFDVDNTLSLDKNEFLEAFAYIVYQISSGNQCSQSNDDDDGDHGSTTSEGKQRCWPLSGRKMSKCNSYSPSFFCSSIAYGYGTLCVFVISACSALGFLIIPLLSESVYETMMAGFVALAFGTLTGDALLHMLPEVNTH